MASHAQVELLWRETSMLDSSLTPDEVPAMLAAAIGQIRFARDYTNELLDATPTELWFRIPEGAPGNLIWQAGHLAVSQYGLLLFRLRGRVPEDLQLIPGRFRKAYSRGSTPSDDADKQMRPEEMRERMDEVFKLSLESLANVSVDTLLQSEEMPYAAYPNKLGSVLFCPLHEHIHAGQIGLIRRGLGLDPIR